MLYTLNPTTGQVLGTMKGPGGTKVADISGKGRVGTINGASQKGGTDCKVNGCFFFDGVNYYIDAGWGKAGLATYKQPGHLQ